MRKEKWKEDIVLSSTFPLSVLFLYSAIIQATEQYSEHCGTIYHLYNVQNGSNMSIYKWSHQV